MCHHCGAQSMESSNCMEKQGNAMESNNGDPVQSYNMCVENKEKVVVKQEDLNPRGNPSISSIASLKSSDSSISSCSDFSVYANSYVRGDAEESGTDSSQEDVSSLKAHLPNFTVPSQANGIHPSNTLVANDLVESGSPSFNEESESFTFNDETDAQFWLPPAEEQEDDILGSFTTYDDDDEDDEYSDSINWRNTNSFIGDEEEGIGSHDYKKEKKKALDEVKNGKFKALVGQLLGSMGVGTSEKAGGSWVDIVTSLSWQAASYIKPDNSEGKAMDPDGYVKIKCIATGSCIQSQVIKGLVFKKHAAHKRMPTDYKNPKLLLIQGALGLSSSGLSSFQSMQQEKDSQKNPIIGMIETYHPNVILVEKTVSRDIQEFILSKGMTLVLDMKIHRLERVARCIGSPILSSDSSIAQNLRQCESFHFEKFVEEHAPFDEGGKRPSKTLMFIEGCPTRLGCTILLMGANSDELKRIKYVVRCAVVMAYHFMLETSFLLDQRAMFSTISLNEVLDAALPTQQLRTVCAGDATVSSSDMSNAATNSSSVIDIPISNGFHEEGSNNFYSVSEGNSSLSFQPYNPNTISGFSSLSTSPKNVMADSVPLFSDSRQSMSNYISLDEKNLDDEIHNIEIDVQISSSPNVENHIDEVPKVISGGEKVLNVEQPHPTSSSCGEPLDSQISSNKDDISAVLESESILVLMSSRNASRGSMCEHSHFSHIKFYRNFDVPLGKFLRDNLLNQRLQCKACGESPEAHYFYYAHHNKQLTIQVRRLDKPLPDEDKGKLWMWSRCGKCKFHNGSSKPTKRVLISTAARGLSFGKFLELSFSNNSSFDRPSSCGHSFHRDFLNFFGLGPMVAIFKYSPVATYSVSLPPEKLDFCNTITGEYLEKDFEDVHMKGITMFLDIENSLKKLQPRFVGVSLNLQGSIKRFSDIEEMLKQERCQFEVDMRNAVHNGNRDEAAYKILSLNRVRLELLIESCVWDRRLHSLLSSDLSVTDTKAIDHRERETHLKEDGNAIKEFSGTAVESGDSVLDNNSHVKIELVTSVEATDFPLKEIPIDDDIQGTKEQDALFASPSVDENTGGLIMGRINENGSSIQDHVAEPDISVHSHSCSESFPGDCACAQLQKEKTIPLTTDIGVSALDLSNSQKGKSTLSLSSKLENDKEWIWTPCSEILREYIKDLLRGSLPKFGPVTSYALETTAHKLITDEGSRLHIPLGTDGYILSDYENEFSSIIACALALLKDLPLANEDLGEDARKEKAFDAKTHENSHILPRLFSLTSPHWSSTGSWDSDAHFQSSTYSGDSHPTSFDGLDNLDSLVSLGANHPEISMGMVKVSGKRKYSVICLYASQFRQLRNRWCPSEVDYIASLSRCKNWDAKGGKSKSFFAKTLDDRFIIKEIKRTEFDSFVQFAPNYFDYMNQCHERRNQTCLAKILGIYQVILRQTKNGKETRHDLMVMENLSFGRSFARSYDLKGALHARLNTAGNGSGDVLLDQNFVNDMNSSPLYVSRKSKRNLQRGVWNDTTFLNSINVMDYSLLVGVDTQRRELVCGIIDYLRQYTWDKQLETWVKSSLVLPKNQLPTVISPKEYKKRFRKFIDTHFLSVPDHWCSQRSLHPCELCGLGDYDNSLNMRSQELGEYEDDSTQCKSPEEGKHEDDSTQCKSAEEGKHEDDSSHNKSA